MPPSINAALQLHRAGKVADAEAMYRQILSTQPNNIDGLHLLGLLLDQTGRSNASLEFFERAAKLAPRAAVVQNSLGTALLNVGRVEEAIAAFRRAISFDPKHARAHSNLLVAMHYVDRFSPKEIFDEHLRWAKRHASGLPQQALQPDRDPNRRLRLGYVSPNFTFHSVGFFIDSLLANHDHDRFEIFCYSDVPQPTPMTQRLMHFADQWRNIFGASDERVAQQIAADQIDILIDLAGHTADSRMTLFARKPAPVQMTYLGYPNTTGLSAVDYRITDALADPTDEFHTEKLLRLPKTAWCYWPIPDGPEVAPSPHAKKGFITFGSFNNLAKITPRMMKLWSTILQRMPNARLLIKARALQEATVQDRVRNEFAGQGVDENRFSLLNPTSNLSQHLAAYADVDIALDTFPYHGTTTTCEALWMGVPVVTLAGKTHVSRVGVSLLTTIGLPNCIAETPEAYVDIAVALASDPPALSRLRDDLRDRMRTSPLLDGKNFTRAFETAIRDAWLKP